MSGSQRHGNAASWPYQKSPYQLSSLPKIRHSKPRPKLVQSVDVLPTLLVRDHVAGDDGERGAAKDGGGRRDARGGDVDDRIATKESSARRNGDEGGTIGEIDGGDGELPTSETSPSTHAPAKRATKRRSCRRISLAAGPARFQPKMVEVVNSESHANSTRKNYDAATNPTYSMGALVCATCFKHRARYTCPKCAAPYCSVRCYKIHDGSVGSGAKTCTESFYKDRVLRHYGNDEEGSDLRGVMTRMHRDINSGFELVENREEVISRMMDNGEGANGMMGDMRSDIQESASHRKSSVMQVTGRQGAEVLSDEDLAELAQYVLQMEEDEDRKGKSGEILERIPPHLLRTFERALASAAESSDSCADVPSGEEAAVLVSKWAPFMERNADGTNMLGGERHDEEKEKRRALWWLPGEDGTDEPSFAKPTLDDRILALPPLPKLAPKKTNPNTLLSYNILEVIYASAFVMRVRRNISSRDDSVIIDEVASLLSQSLVLAGDARYSSVREALMACSERLAENRKMMAKAASRPRPATEEMESRGALSWDTLAADAAAITRHRRQVLRMLFEALDILRAGLEGVRERLKSLKTMWNGGSTRDVEISQRQCESGKRQCKFAVKKVEYFLSWSSVTWSDNLGRELSEEAYAFVADWKLEAQVEETSVEQLIRGMYAAADGDNGLSRVVFF